ALGLGDGRATFALSGRAQLERAVSRVERAGDERQREAHEQERFGERLQARHGEEERAHDGRHRQASGPVDAQLGPAREAVAPEREQRQLTTTPETTSRRSVTGSIRAPRRLYWRVTRAAIPSAQSPQPTSANSLASSAPAPARAPQGH